jgi:hypothetical protein
MGKRSMFVAYMVVIFGGLAYFIAVGLMRL